MTENITKKVKSIQFSMLSPNSVKRMSVAKVVTPELYDREGYPVDGGLMDIRMGVIDPGLRCKTCGQRLKECPGHFGYMDLARPILHIKYLDTILRYLRSTCMDCGRILVEGEKVKKHLDNVQKAEQEKRYKVKKNLINAFANSIKLIKKCPHCQAKKKKITIEKPSTILEDGKRLTPIQIKARLEKINDEDIITLGNDPKNSRPEWTVLDILAVPPVTIRPSITLQNGERSEDDLTHKLSDIVRINQRLFENINAGAPEIIIEDLWDLLQYHVTTFFDNSVAQVPVARHRSGQPLKTLHERIKSKEGRFRHNLAGKRVNFSARTVISADPKIKFNEVGVPKIIAMELTIPEKVTEWNIDWLKSLVKKGPKNYPGANYVIRPDGRKKSITEETQEILIEELQPGYIVERHIVNGDISIFNRQPSLHRMSIMCHKILILPGRSFRLNPAVCTPYGADFDGDEMNLHIPQTEEARAEAEILMSVENHIISPKNGLNIIGSIEDAISGLYLLTKKMKFSKGDATELLFNASVIDEKMKNFKKEVTGKEVFSVLLPNDFSFVGNSKNGDDVVIKKGQLIEGVIDKALVGEDNGQLIREIYSKYDEKIGIEFLARIFKLGIETLLRSGFTIGISDSDVPEKINKKNQDLIKKAKQDANNVIKQYELGKLESLPGNSIEETLEIRITEILNKVRNDVSKQVSDSVNEDNPTIIMASSGAKGNLLNVAMMSSCVGQQAIRGKRVQGNYSGRALSLFKKNDPSPEAHGFIEKGYKQGLKPYEYFFGAMTGRDALMDVALRTPKSGYLYRRLSNALQDIRIEYDSTVRDAEKSIIQFKYGEDGIDISRSDGGKINVKKIIKQIKGK
ncbi:DNA-directed RNA polymerase subunit A' [Candidatus Woesearchaeota archaeon]|jgi:DNA-directed RNA polymerase subunit A'|nr:DNA-directed RNA polymerase subunit A' [Candidatus Woesearchaeota archaeon]MBT7238315.1 DNA-directed RNA polymerase subunit A' [Candidatus Woesearchaeota archaeon]